MPSSPNLKVYDRWNTYQASCKEIEAAAALVAFYGEYSTIRDGHVQHSMDRGYRWKRRGEL